MAISEVDLGLCRNHAVNHQRDRDLADLYAPLVRNSQGFQTAQGINYALTNLYELLAKNRISARRAAVLSFISSLLLRTLPAIDADNAAGITDPTKHVTTVPAVITPISKPTTTWDDSIPDPDPEKKPS